jgi:hypothetical protein
LSGPLAHATVAASPVSADQKTLELATNAIPHMGAVPEAQAARPPNAEGPARGAPAGPSGLPASPGELQARVDAISAAPGWASDWAERLRESKYANLDALRNTMAMMLSLAGQKFCEKNLAGFRSLCRLVLNLASGKNWDDAASRPITWPADREIISQEEAVATFAEAEEARRRRHKTFKAC